MKSRKTLATLVGLVVGVALFIVPIAAAHHPIISVTLDCNGKVSYTVTSWNGSTAAQRTFTGVKVYWGSTVVGTGNFNSADNFTFSGSFNIDSSVTSITLTADTNGTWGDGYTGHDTTSDSATRPTNCASITTSLSSASVTAGSSVHDSATLHGQTSNAGGTVAYKVYTDSSCTQNAQSAGTKTVSSGHVPDSDSITFNSAGDYYWQASYSGDNNGNNTAKSACTEEHLVVTRRSPSISTTLSSATITVGGAIHDSATLTGETSNAGGTVTYSVFTNTSCTGGAQDAGTKNVSSGIVPDSNPITFNTAGDYYWQAVYSGDANNNGATSTCTSEHLVVSKTTPSIATTLSSSTITVGGTIHDSATLTGATSNAGGHVTYTVYTDTACSQGAQNAGTKTVSSGIVPDSNPITFDTSGDYYWQASYDGDANNKAATSPCTSEHLVVNKTTPSVATTLSATEISVGGPVHDTATLSDVTTTAGGTVTYTVYTDTSCSAGAQDAGTKTVTNGVVPDSNPITFNTSGDYYWQASYTGDANNGSAKSPCTSEHLVVNQKSPGISTSLSSPTITVGGSVHDTATLTGMTPTAGGTVTYTVFADTGCSQGAQDAGTKTVTGGVVPDSNPITFTTAGDYYWQAVYTGDANNKAATSPCTSEHLVVNKTTPSVATTLSASTITVGGTVHDSSTLSGVTSDAGGTVTYTVYRDGECSTGAQDAGTKTVTGGVVPDSNTLTFNAAGDYYWQASYSGDANNSAAKSPCTSEHLVVNKKTPTIATLLSAPTITAGGTVNDTATLSGATSTAGGTVTYSVYTNTSCTGGAQDAGTKTVTNGVVPNSNTLTFNTAGDYYWQASYSGDANNSAATSLCTSEHLVVSSPPPPQSPAISISKNPTSQTIQSGSTASFSITVTNSGNVTLTNVTVSDPQSPDCSKTSSNIPALASMAPGASVSYNCSLANVTSNFTNVATATGTPPSGPNVTANDSATVTVTVPPPAPTHPAIGIVKDPTSQSVTLGGTANFKITVTNTGDVTLSSVTVTDPLSPDCNRDVGTLTAGQSKSYTCTSTNVRKDFRNVATATGQPPTGPSVSADDSADVNVAFTPPKPKPENPKITIVKSPKQQNVTTKATTTRSTAGATRTTIEYGSAHFTITVKNTGDVKLHSVVVTDPLSKSCERQLGALAPGASRTYRCVRSVVSSGFTNVASASGLSPKGKKVQDSDHAVVTVTVKNSTTGSDISAGKHQTSKPTTPTTPLTPPKTTASGSPSFTG